SERGAGLRGTGGPVAGISGRALGGRRAAATARLGKPPRRALRAPAWLAAVVRWRPPGLAERRRPGARGLAGGLSTARSCAFLTHRPRVSHSGRHILAAETVSETQPPPRQGRARREVARRCWRLRSPRRCRSA